MFLIPESVRQLFRLRRGDIFRIFSADEELITSIRLIAVQEGRSEEEIFNEFARSGHSQFMEERELERRWDSLSYREQEVAGLTCLGYRNNDISNTLKIAPETVKTHLENIYDKFNLHSRGELRVMLKNWNFSKWWKDTHI